MFGGSARAFLLPKPYPLNTSKTITRLLVAAKEPLNSPPSRHEPIAEGDLGSAAAVDQISNVVRRDFYIEQSLNSLRISSLSSDLVRAVLRACNGCAMGSLRFFHWACRFPSYSPAALDFEELLLTLARARCWQKLWTIVDQMRERHNLSPSPGVVLIIIEEHGKEGRLDQAVEVFNNCKNLGCPQTTGIYNSLLFVLCEAKNFHAAHALIRRMVRKGGVPDKRTFSIVVNALCSGGKTEEADGFLKEMDRMGFGPPVHRRELLILGLLKAGYVEAAHQMLRKMMGERLLPDFETLRGLLEALLKLGDAHAGLDLFHGALKLGLRADLRMYKLVIQAVSKAGMVDEASRLLHKLMDDGLPALPSQYGPIIEGLCRNGRFEDAFHFFGCMKGKGHPPNKPIYTMLITLCARGGRFVDAARYLVEMVELNMVPMSRCLDMVRDGLQNCGEHDLAKQMEQLEMSPMGSLKEHSAVP